MTEAQERASAEQPVLVVGTMSGTSTDGYDVVVARIEGRGETARAEIVAFESFPLPDDMRARIFEIYPPTPITSGSLGQLSADLAESHAAWILAVIEKSGFQPSDIHVVGYHGIAAFHGTPDRERSLPGFHLEIGEAAVIAERTGITVVSDMRTRDIAAGGEGAPLSPFSDWLLFRDPAIGRAVQNIGGIANVTGLQPGARREDVIAFDTGPGNVVIDTLVQDASNGRDAFDRDGAIGARGQVSERLLDELMETPYLSWQPPKSTGRELFGKEFTQRLRERAAELGLSFEDSVATATAFTARTIVDQYRRWLHPRFRIDEVILGGGGCHNATLVRMLRERLDPTPVLMHEAFGIDGDAREALFWGIMANETMHGRPSNMPSVTGARRPVILGKVVLGRTWPTSDRG